MVPMPSIFRLRQQQQQQNQRWRLVVRMPSFPQSAVLLLLLLLIQSHLLVVVDGITREGCLENYLPERVACYDDSNIFGDACRDLPIPSEAFPSQHLNDQGFALIRIRDTITTQAYVVTENTALALIVLDIASEETETEEEETEEERSPGPVFTVSAGATLHDNARDDRKGKDDNKNGNRKRRKLKGHSDHNHNNNRLLKEERKKKNSETESREPKDDVDVQRVVVSNAAEQEESPFEELAVSPTHEAIYTAPPTFAPTPSPSEPTETPGKGKRPTQQRRPIHVAMIDFPEAFLRRDPSTGKTVNNIMLPALEEILTEHNFSKQDIEQALMIYTHGHTDHTGGANFTLQVLRDDWKVPEVHILASEAVVETYETLIERGLWTFRAPIPTVPVPTYDLTPEVFTVSLGQSTQIQLHPTNGHTSAGQQDFIVYMEALPASRSSSNTNNGGQAAQPPILMYVDAIFPQWAPPFRFGTDDLLSYILLHDKLLEFDMEGFDDDDDDGDDDGEEGVFIGGHVNQVGTRQDILLSQELLEVVLDAASDALMAVDINPIAVDIGFFDPNSIGFSNRWALFRDYKTVVLRHCAKSVVQQMGCQLAGLDVVAESLCDIGQLFWGIVA